ncbi:MAG: PKD domain-containing protein [Candidatus Pacebacteria bacterium]|nr:PKD domain-containing protein [Candidatus Paceibacterota bacterium]
MKIFQSFFSILLFAFVVLIFATQVYANLKYGSGEYVNICGTGLAATENKCNKGCDTSSGTCSASGNYVVKFTCNGRTSDGECRSNETSFSTSQSLSGTTCGKTVQIDVFDRTCRNQYGQWETCALQDYIVWYSGDCSTTTTQRSCNESCSANSDCGSGLTCYSGSCRNPSCASQSSCQCSPPTPSACNGSCATNSDCASGLVCRSGYCRNSICDWKTSCQCDGPTPTPTPTPEYKSSCDSLQVVGGNNSNVPSTVTLRARASDNKGSIQRYRYYFGDGKQEEITSVEIQHKYETSGSFLARVDAQDSRGNWKSSSSCEAWVYVNSSPVESFKSDCSNLFVNGGNNNQPPTTVQFTLTGYDNKGGINKYKLDFGNGIVKETDGNTFEQRYDIAGTYVARGYIRDNKGTWKGGTGSCSQTVYVNTKPLTQQPKTGTPTLLTLGAIGSGFMGVLLLTLKKRFVA